jgi:chromosomal replication initiator protein
MAKALWKKIKGELSGQLPAHAISTWFEPIEPITKEGGELILEVPNQFFYDWIESHYRAHLNKALVSVGEGVISTRFIISADKQEIKPNPNQDLTPTKKSPLIPVLNKDHKFELFIEGSNNQFAKTAAEAVAENPGKQSFNPLIIYGGTGLGKTHLLHAIGNRLLETKPDCRIVIATSEKFTLDFVNGLRKNRTIEFARHYRQADILLIDDIQFFRGKEQTQEQFFHTFNELYQSGKQIVLTADRYPGEMQGLQDRLLSRFQSGLSVDIQPPDFEVRVAILLDKAERNGVDLPYDIIEFIATHVRSNIRDLEGTVIRLLARSSLMNQDIDRKLVQEVVQERVGKKPMRDLSMEDIVRKVSELTGISEEGIVGKSRRKEIVEARQTAMFLCRNILDNSLSSVGMYFGGRDHTTVMHSIKIIEKKKSDKKNIGENIAQITQELSFTSF